jgi:outer membrane protein TolC
LIIPILVVLLSVARTWPAAATTIDLATIQRQALEHSFTLKMAASDIALKQIEQQEARSLYLPTFSLRYDHGYAWALDNQEAAVAIGDSVSATSLSTWRNSLSASTSLLLYDGGARGQKMAQARHGLTAAQLAREAERQQVGLKVLDAYRQGVQEKIRLSTLGRILAFRKQLYRTLERLQQAGTVDRASMQDAALELATTLSLVDDAQVQLQRALETMTEMTGETYPLAETDFADLPPSTYRAEEEIPVEQLPQIRVFDENLARLRAERSAAWRAMSPSIEAYGNYRLYGADPESSSRTMENLSGRDATVALVVQWELFSGFRDRLQLARLDEQILRLGWQRRQRIAELRHEINGLQPMIERLPEHSGHQRDWRQAAEVVAEATTRLRKQGVLDEPGALRREIDLLNKSLEERLRRIRQQADLLRLELMGQGLQS